MNSKKITAIIMYWYPYVGAIQPIYKAIFKNLSKNNYTINIIAGIPHYRKGREELWHDYRGVFHKECIEDELSIKRTFVFSPKIDIGFDKIGILRRFINYFSFFVSAFLAIIFDKKIKPKIFFIPSFPPFFIGLLACLISAIKKVPFVYNVQDIYPDILYSIKLFRLRPIAYFLEEIEKFVYSRSKHLIAISDKMKDTLHSKGVPLEKISVIANFCATNFVKPFPKKNDFSKEYNIQDKFIVLYAGNIGEPQGVEYIINAAKIISCYPDILFAFVGRGEKKQEAEKFVRDSNLRNVIFIPLQPFEKMPLVWASADISVVSLRRNLSHLAFPSKIYSILSSGRPIIVMVDKKSEIWEFVEESNAGFCVESEDSKELANKILSLYNNPSLGKRMGENGGKFVEKNFSKELILSKYKKLFDNLFI